MADLLRMEGLTPHRPRFSLQNRGFVISSYHLQGETSTARLFHTAFAPEHPSQTARTLAARPQSSRCVVPIRMVGIHADVHGHAIARVTGGAVVAADQYAWWRTWEMRVSLRAQMRDQHSPSSRPAYGHRAAAC